jgi:hypothetical protein
MCGSAPKSNNDQIMAQQQAEADETRRREEERQARINAGVAAVRDAFKGYDDAYYDRQRSAFVAANEDTLRKQQAQEGEQAFYNMARVGTLNSSMGNRMRGDLAAGFARQNNDLFQGAEDYVAQQRDQVFNTQSQLEAQVRSSADETGAANMATAQAGNINRTPSASSGAWLAPAIQTVAGGVKNYNSGQEAGFYSAAGAKLFGNDGTARTVR